ncbi:MAG: fatty acid desaturase [Deltaproteobacteria bacterium]|nr:fatty acid desaturase [Deltaproteobacteria bacterium]MBW2392750.1 fatty acid desaturase [Deltaproteobacteria bacterium]
MSATTAPPEAPALRPGEVLRIWFKHLTALYIPGLSLAFVLTGPHPWWVAILFMLPMVWAHHADCTARVEYRQPAQGLPAWPFEALVYLLVGLQLWIIGGLVVLFAGQQGVFSVDMVMAFLVVGGSSGFAIITAHELIHRQSKLDRLLGRLLLSVVLYEHFFTEHLRGHHVRVGTADDPATARFGERYEPFFRRTVPAQFRSAWRIETKRLGDERMQLLDRRQLGNRVLQGVIFEWTLAFTILGVFGVAAFLAFLAQAFMAVRLLEAVNYFEHWGLERQGKRVEPIDSWDTHGWFTYYGLIGLSRHADHHAHPIRPYQKLRVWKEAPTLPYGYVGAVDQVQGNNAEFMKTATLELGRRRLGPFLPEGEDRAALPPEASLARLEEAKRLEDPPFAEKPTLPVLWLQNLSRRLGQTGTRVAVMALLLLVTTSAVHWESGSAETGFIARLALHAWIFASVAVLIFVGHRLKLRTEHETFAWSAAMGVLVVLGAASGWLAG